MNSADQDQTAPKVITMIIRFSDRQVWANSADQDQTAPKVITMIIRFSEVSK